MKRLSTAGGLLALLLAGCPGEERPTGADAGAADSGPADAGQSAVRYDWSVIAQYTDALHALLVVGSKLYAVDSASNTVRVFDTETGAAAATIAVGTLPGALASDGAQLFVVNRYARELGDPYISIVDPATDRVVSSLDVSIKQEGSDPDNYPMTNFPWDACALDGVLYVDFPTNAIPDVRPVTIATRSEQASWPAGSGPGDLHGAAGKLAVVQGRAISNDADDAVAIYGVDGTLQQTFETGGKLHDVIDSAGKFWIARAPDGSERGSLVVIDVDDLAQRAVEVGAGPYGLAALDGRVYAVCQYAARIDVVDAASETVLQSIPLDDLTPAVVNPRAIAIAASGHIFVEADGLIGMLTPRN